ncbi:hypothetical protein AAG906_034555 [Vitis piasezkii]
MNKITCFFGILIKKSPLFFNFFSISTAIQSFQQPYNLTTCIASLQASTYHKNLVKGKFTFPCAIKACLDVLEIKKIHELLFKFGLELDVFIGSALVNCYLKFGLMEHAKVAFEELPIRDVVLWNAMMVLETFRRKNDESVVPSKFTDTGRIKNALEIFEMMRENDIFSWNSIVSVHEQCGDHDGTLRLLDRIFAALMHDREIHGYMIVSGLGKDGKNIDDVLLKMYLMHNHCLQNPLIYMMS